MPKYQVPSKKDKIDPFDVLCEKADRLVEVYTRDSYWQAVGMGVKAIREGKVTAEVIQVVEKEWRCWGALMSNKDQLTLLLERLHSA